MLNVLSFLHWWKMFTNFKSQLTCSFDLRCETSTRKWDKICSLVLIRLVYYYSWKWMCIWMCQTVKVQQNYSAKMYIKDLSNGHYQLPEEFLRTNIYRIVLYWDDLLNFRYLVWTYCNWRHEHVCARTCQPAQSQIKGPSTFSASVAKTLLGLSRYRRDIDALRMRNWYQ